MEKIGFWKKERKKERKKTISYFFCEHDVLKCFLGVSVYVCVFVFPDFNSSNIDDDDDDDDGSVDGGRSLHLNQLVAINEHYSTWAIAINE